PASSITYNIRGRVSPDGPYTRPCRRLPHLPTGRKAGQPLSSQYLCDLEFVLVHVFGHAQSILDIVVDILTISVTNHTVCCAGTEQIHCQGAHVGSVHTILCCRA